MTDEKRVIYAFDRYVDGKLMAEGCKITKATSEKDAFERAAALYPKSPKSTFKLRGPPHDR